jgi:hypothetical protein
MLTLICIQLSLIYVIVFLMATSNLSTGSDTTPNKRAFVRIGGILLAVVMIVIALNISSEFASEVNSLPY